MRPLFLFQLSGNVNGDSPAAAGTVDSRSGNGTAGLAAAAGRDCKNLHQRQLARVALTGPIARGDAGTVAGHLQVLPEELQSVYRELALQTVALAEANGSIDQAAAAKMQGLLRG